MTGTMLDLEEGEDGVVLRVRAAPGAARERIVGLLGRALKVAVTAPPSRGRANRRVLEVLARELGLAASRFSLVSGSGSREKRIRIRNVSARELRDRLAPHLGPRSAPDGRTP